jgi:hypothetical protein
MDSPQSATTTMMVMTPVLVREDRLRLSMRNAIGTDDVPVATDLACSRPFACAGLSGGIITGTAVRFREGDSKVVAVVDEL